MTSCVPKTRVSFVVRPVREKGRRHIEGMRRKVKRERERETYICLYVRMFIYARKTGKYDAVRPSWCE